VTYVFILLRQEVLSLGLCFFLLHKGTATPNYTPGTCKPVNFTVLTCELSSYQVFHSFYEEMRSKFSISAKAKNFFLSLAESIAQTLNVTSCYVCRRTNMGDHWPWEAREPDPQEPFNETAFPKHRKDV
jgi:hypothetical protein